MMTAPGSPRKKSTSAVHWMLGIVRGASRIEPRLIAAHLGHGNTATER